MDLHSIDALLVMGYSCYFVQVPFSTVLKNHLLQAKKIRMSSCKADTL